MKFKPAGSRTFQDYRFVVITETDEDRRPPGSKAEYMDWFHKGQIVVCDFTGGTPIEVGTHTKPGRLNCKYEIFQVLQEAIEFAYTVTESGFDHKKQGRHKNTWQDKKKSRSAKFRHFA